MPSEFPTGRLIFVVGPSGAGKDTLLEFARAQFRSRQDIRFVRRFITRPAGIGEDHAPVSSDEFQDAAAQGRFSIHWQAHGLHYGLPAEIDMWLSQGQTVAANGSRAAIDKARLRYPNLLVAVITATEEVLALRLKGRGRESVADQQARLERLQNSAYENDADIVINNSDDLERAGHALTAFIAGTIRGRAPARPSPVEKLVKPIVLVHGLFGNLADTKILSAFGDNIVFAPDLLGYGPYQSSPTGWTLHDQADHVARLIRGAGYDRAHLVGHSVGGAVSALVAAEHPDLVETFTSVEGNFTLADAFWTAELAAKSHSEVKTIIDGYREDPASWFAANGVPATEWTTGLATKWLDNQPSETIRFQAKAVVEATTGDYYLDGIKKVLNDAVPIHLISGAITSAAWNVPDWLNAGCRSRVNMPGKGHFMMAEAPDAFASVVVHGLR